MTSQNKPKHYEYRLRKEDIATYVAISDGDATILNTYKKMTRRSRVAVLHDFIGHGAKCF